MTGEKNRLKTHEQLWKLEDGELSTPKHDELVLQLMNPKNAIKLLCELGYDKWNWEYKTRYLYPHSYESSDHYYPRNYNFEPKIREEFDAFLSNAHKSLSELGTNKFDEFYQSDALIPHIDIDCEFPVKSEYNNFIVGYLDLRYSISQCNCRFPILSPEVHEYIDLFHVDTRKPDPIIRDTDKIKVRPKGVVEVKNTSFYEDGDDFNINIEVKPKIDSFGKTLRQINTYREYDPLAKYIIYSPDTMFKAAFETHGVKLITPSDLGINS